MSKKRKTRKQKEQTTIRHAEQLQHIHIDAPVYSVVELKTKKTPKSEAPKIDISTFEQKDAAYLRHDIVAITAASGIIVAFNILLFVLLTSGVIRLNFLGY
ncbi:MAG: hypothetical protein Q7T54_02210 [Candidatus Levybacteria bacterium]|nr:hypothetical protein [Candidatus Levybacteria bacterium]